MAIVNMHTGSVLDAYNKELAHDRAHDLDHLLGSTAVYGSVVEWRVERTMALGVLDLLGQAGIHPTVGLVVEGDEVIIKTATVTNELEIELPRLPY